MVFSLTPNVTPPPSRDRFGGALARRGRPVNTPLYSDWYGRGSDIWPPTNIEFPVQLKDSFPGGRIPDIALEEQRGKTFVDPTAVATVQRRGLRWVAYLAVIAALTFVKGSIIGPMDIGAILVWAFYNYLLVQLADSGNGIAAVPSAGHVPHLVRNPLSHPAPQSGNGGLQIHWDAWINFVLPIALILGLSATMTESSAEEWYRVALGRPLLWWMTVQVADDILENSNSSESDSPIPLPIQFWIRCSSRFCRWALLTVAVLVTQWPALVPNATGSAITLNGSLICGFLPLAHWIWSTTQVFGYWIPIASMKYMRAHWTSTEAETLTLQPTAIHHYAQAVSVLTEED